MDDNFIRRSEQENPYLEIEKFRNNFETFFHDFESYNKSESSHFGKVLEEKESHFLVTIDMPGVDQEDIEILIEDNTLTINANRNEESRIFDYSTSLMLPTSVNHDEIKAMYENGVLRVALPKEGKAEARRIELSKEDNKGFFKGLFSKDKSVDVKH